MKCNISFLLMVVCVMGFSSCHVQKRVIIPSGGQLVARAPIAKESVKQDTVKAEAERVAVAVEVSEPVKPESVKVAVALPTEPEVKVDVKPEVKSETVVVKQSVEPAASAVKINVRRESFAAVDKVDEVVARKDYHVVVGSFGKQDNAVRLRSLLVSKGHPAIVVVNQAGMYRVIVTSCETYELAHRAADAVRADYPDAWILAQK